MKKKNHIIRSKIEKFLTIKIPKISIQELNANFYSTIRIWSWFQLYECSICHQVLFENIVNIRID